MLQGKKKSWGGPWGNKKNLGSHPNWYHNNQLKRHEPLTRRTWNRRVKRKGGPTGQRKRFVQGNGGDGSETGRSMDQPPVDMRYQGGGSEK